MVGMKWFSRVSLPPSSGRFETLLAPHLERLFRLAYRFTGSREDAEDLVQNLMIKLIRQEDKLADVELLAPWLARSLYHLYVDQKRQHARTEAALGHPIADADFLDAIPDEVSESPEQGADRHLTERRLAAALAQLPVDQRALIAWHDMEGYTLEELAVALEVPLGTLKSRLHRGRAALRLKLMEPSAMPKRVYGVRTPV